MTTDDSSVGVKANNVIVATVEFYSTLTGQMAQVQQELVQQVNALAGQLQMQARILQATSEIVDAARKLAAALEETALEETAAHVDTDGTVEDIVAAKAVDAAACDVLVKALAVYEKIMAEIAAPPAAAAVPPQARRQVPAGVPVAMPHPSRMPKS